MNLKMWKILWGFFSEMIYVLGVGIYVLEAEIFFAFRGIGVGVRV